MRIDAPASPTDSNKTEYFDTTDMSFPTDPMQALQTRVSELEGMLQARTSESTRASISVAPKALFHGAPSENVTTWLFQLNSYYVLQEIPMRLRVAHAISLLRGDALQWYQNQTATYEDGSTGIIRDWTEFAGKLQEAYRPPHHEYHLHKQLLSLRQTGSIQEYNAKFRELYNQSKDMAKTGAVLYYIAGLKERTRVAVETQVPDDIEQAIRLAAAYDEAAFGFRSGYRPSHSFVQSPAETAPMDLSVVDGRLPRSRLSEEERDECMRKGLCFRCREPGHTTRYCSKNRQESGKDSGRV
jgi:hypothetical protein